MIESDILKGGELEVVGLLPYASNYTYLARLKRGGHEELVVYKPIEGETPLWDFPAGTLALREVAAYLVSEASGWGLVPPTVLREGPLGVGAVQLFIQHNPITTAFDLLATHQRDLKRIVLFDLLVNNADRKAGHVLLAPDRKLWAVDHGICFHVQAKLRTVLWDFAGQRIPDQEKETLSLVADALDEELAVLLATLLDQDELDSLRRRAENLLEMETFPQPGPGRNYPWPPV